MRVIVTNQYKQYVVGTELDITTDLYEANKKHFKPIQTIKAKTDPAPVGKYVQSEQEEE